MKPKVWIALLAWLAVPPLTDVLAQQLSQTVNVWPMGTNSQNVMIASLAGIVNRNTNGELLLSPTNGAPSDPLFWLTQLKAAYPQVQTQIQSSPTALINQYKSMLSGYVLYDRNVNPDSINIATSIAGVTNALMVDPSTVSLATVAGLPLIADARTMTYSQTYAQYGSQFNKNMLFFQNPSIDADLRDFAVMNRGFMYYTSNPTVLTPYVSNQNPQGRIFGFASDEGQLFTQASQHNQQAVAADLTKSNSTTSRWQVPLTKQPYHAPANSTPQSGKHYVAFVMTDGDNEEWLSSGFASDSRNFGSSYRGNFDMTWDISGSLADMNPVALNYIYQHASNGAHHDSFVAAGGLGFMYPSQYPDVQGLATSIAHSMQTMDEKVASIYDRVYDTSRLYPIVDEAQVLGILARIGDTGRDRNGAIEIHNGKPIISVKYSLADGSDSAFSIAKALNDNTHLDPFHDDLSYTVVQVSPWTSVDPMGIGAGNAMGDLNQLVQWLDPEVQVITLDEMMVDLRNNFGLPVPEPSALVLFAVGAIYLLNCVRRRREQ